MIFLNDSSTQDAVSRNFEIIGEASARLTKDFKELHNYINWREVKDFRKKLIHDYWGTIYTTGGLILQDDLDILQQKLTEINKKFCEEI